MGQVEGLSWGDIPGLALIQHMALTGLEQASQGVALNPHGGGRREQLQIVRKGDALTTITVSAPMSASPIPGGLPGSPHLCHPLKLYPVL